ncbi:MAG TPA: Zn-dependent alcohol dehydrogenase [Chloroflexota bacterium]|nr:Zn-dependent alcohol dehydrogenase [Chloroflexota bacterium]
MFMKAPVLHRIREPLIVENVQLDEPRQGEVMVKMTASGVCHSCLHFADGSWAGAAERVPIVLGDEGAGVVERVGPGVTRLSPGDHVILSWSMTCGRCHYCVIGRPVLCENQPASGFMLDGTTRMHLRGKDVRHYGTVASYASYSVVPEGCAVKIRKDMPLEKAALIGCSVMTGVGSVINTAAVPAGASLAVFGCGGVGLNAVQGGRLASADPLIAVDINPKKLEFARAMGASHLVHATAEDVPATIKRITGRGADYAVVTVGDTRVVQQAWYSLAKGGTCVVVGLPPSDQTITISPSALVGPERRMVGSSYGSARVMDDFSRMVNLYMSGKLRIDELITRRYGIDEATQAFHDLAAGENARGLIVF